MLVRSSSSDDFAAILDAVLDSVSDYGDDEGDYNLDLTEVKRRKVEISEGVINPPSSSGSSRKKDVCQHSKGYFSGMCMTCGHEAEEESSGVPISYIDKNLRLTNDEIERLRNQDLKRSMHDKKLYLVLDLDHTLLNSTRFSDITSQEGYLKGEDLPVNLKSSLFILDRMHMMTKLRPFVKTFLKEANNLFEMYIYTMGERSYALEMAKLLDSGGNYFKSRIIAQEDCTRKHQKGLDIVLGQESAVLIMDDTEEVWGQHKDHLILMERYHFFASSCKHCPSLSVLRRDESETDGALSTVLRVLRRIHGLFFDESREDNVEDRDVRQILKTVRGEILKGCRVVFSCVFPTDFRAEDHYLWKIAEQLGATCTLELDPSVTHVVALDSSTHKSCWAVKEKKFLVHPRWIEASKCLWLKQPEGNFPVPRKKRK